MLWCMPSVTNMEIPFFNAQPFGWGWWQVVAGYPCIVLPASWPHPPSVTAGRGRPSSSSQRHGWSWPREDLQTHRFMGLRTLLHTVSTYAILRNLYRTWIRSCVRRSADLTQTQNSKIALFKSVEFIETCSIAQSKKLTSPLFYEKKPLFSFLRGG